MLHLLRPLLLTVVTVLLCTACAPEGAGTAEGLQHARLLRMRQEGTATVAEVMDPWHEGRVMHRYLLVPRADSVPAGLPEGTLVRTPLRRMVATSSVHAALAADLGCRHLVAGLCDTAYVMHPLLRADLRSGRTAALGASFAPDMERLVALAPDAVTVSPMEHTGYGALAATGIPLIECADYMEQTPLGRAEWMRFYGRLWGCGERADSLFAATERTYDALCRAAAEARSPRPRLIVDMKQAAAWYVPGADSYLARLYADAGADYVFARHRGSGSVALSVETVMAEGAEADVWIVKYGQAEPRTYASLAADYAPVRRLRPWRERRVWACNTLAVPYYEETPFHPERLLRDLVAIFHPEVDAEAQPAYYHPMP